MATLPESVIETQADDIFNKFMQKYKDELLTNQPRDRLLKISKERTSEQLKEILMNEGKKRWGVLEKNANVKWRKVKAVNEIIDRKGITVLREMIQELLNSPLSGTGRLVRKKSKSKAKAKAQSRISRKDNAYTSPPMQQPMPSPGVQPQHYRAPVGEPIHPQASAVMQPQLTKQLAQQVAE